MKKIDDFLYKASYYLIRIFVIVGILILGYYLRREYDYHRYKYIKERINKEEKQWTN